jgi:hypothetical protein
MGAVSECAIYGRHLKPRQNAVRQFHPLMERPAGDPSSLETPLGGFQVTIEFLLVEGRATQGGRRFRARRL